MKRMATPIAPGARPMSARALEKLRRIHRRRDKGIESWIRRNSRYETTSRI